MNITIDLAKSEDAFGFQKVYYESWLDTYPNKEAGITLDDIKDFIKDAFTEKTIKERANRITNMPPDRKLFIAMEGTKVVGYCNIAVHKDKNQLQAIYLLPDYYRKGIGTLLWNKAKTILDPLKPTVVQVAIYNKRAISFYKKLGFQETNKIFKDEKNRMKSGAIIEEMEMIMPEKVL
jgi:ribosomal protein S18 acetylase RimI-like enzyme